MKKDKKRMNRYAGFAAIFIGVCLTVAGSLTVEAAESVKAADTDTDYVYVLYNSQNGLPTSEANDIVQTADGIIWIASYGGLTRYDGLQYERISAVNGISSANDLLSDAQDYLWIGTSDKGVAIYVDGEYRFIDEAAGMPSDSVRNMAEDSQGNVYVATTAGVARIHRADYQVEAFADTPLAGQYIEELAVTSEDDVLCLTNEGVVYRLKDGQASVEDVSQDGTQLLVTSVYVDKNGNEYYGTENNTIYMHDVGTDETAAISCGNLKYINAIYETSKAELWICADNGIGYFADGEKIQVMQDLELNSSVDGMMEDYEGNLWFASSRQGILKRTENYFTNISLRAGFEDNVVNAIRPYEGLMYAATDAGLLAFDDVGHAVSNELTDYIGTARVRDIMVDRDNRLWLCTYADNGLICYDGEDFKSYTQETGMLSKKIRSIVQLSDGRIYVATSEGINIIEEDQITGTITSADGLTNPEVLTMYEADNHDVYVGTDGGGVFVLRDDKIVQTIGKHEGLLSQIVMRVCYDDNAGGYWFLTNNSIAFYDGSTIKSIEKFPYSNNFDMYFQKDTIWVLSGSGIYSTTADSMLSNEPLIYAFYDYQNGMPSIPTANSFSYQDENDRLYVCGSSGIYCLDMTRMSQGGSDAKIAISSVILDGERQWLVNSDEVSIAKDVKRIRIDALAINYTLADPIVEYYLEGFDTEPIRSLKSDIEDIVYTNLKGGTYTFHFSIVDPNTGDIVNTKNLVIKKETRFEDTVYFPLLIIVATLFLSGLFSYLLFRQRFNRNLLRQAEEQNGRIQDALNEAEAATNAKTMFLSNMSHDMRTPMNAILGMSNLALDSDNVLEMKDYLKNINGAGTQLLDLINDTLDVSRIENGKMELQPSNIWSTDLLAAVISSIKINAAQKGVIFNVQKDDFQKILLYVDAVKIQKVLVNLLSNAVKFTPEGGHVDLILENINRDNGQSYFKISIRDNGCGMAQEFIEHIFEPFAQEKRTVRMNQSGTGLGMTIVKNILDLMGGKIEVHSEIDKGTEFCVWLSFKHSKDIIHDDADTNTQSVQSKESDHRMHQHVLVCEDHPMNQQIIRKLLEKYGCLVDIADNGKIGVDMFSQSEVGHYGLIFMDIRMPEMDGLTAAKTIRALGKADAQTVPIVAMTANAFEQDREASIAAGMNDHLTKPIDTGKLYEILEKYL